MPKDTSRLSLSCLLKQVQSLTEALRDFKKDTTSARPGKRATQAFVDKSGLLLDELREVREQVSPVYFGAIGITLGRSDSIAKFFAFCFTNQEKRRLDTLLDSPFYGAGVYAIYYHGETEKAYMKPVKWRSTP